MQTLALWLYSLVTWALQPLVRARLKRRAVQEPLYGQWTEERFGHYSQTASEGWVWVHAVSLGETRAAAILLHELRLSVPGMKLLLTHGTATGREEGAKLLQAGDVQVWQPWDSAQATRRFLANFKPRIGIVMETEVWPQLCAACAQARVPMVLANARLNAHSLKKAQRLAALSRPAFGSFAQVLAQTQGDEERLHAAGTQQVSVMGNLKFDVTPDAALQALGQRFKQISGARPIIMLASSREGEEAQFFKQIKALAQQINARAAIDSIASDISLQPQWLIVPRHPQRFDEVQRLCEQQGLSISRRSSWADAPQAADVWLGDSMGEMAMYYALADIALLGGSFEPLGGQNLIEAIAAGCPVVMGPHTFNFAEACNTAQEMRAALRCTDMAQAVATAVHTVQSPQQISALQQQGQQWLAQSRGAAQRMAAAIAKQLPD
jgi:3-deoxy-D-manno-octulosonic-acid transferase